MIQWLIHSTKATLKRMDRSPQAIGITLFASTMIALVLLPAPMMSTLSSCPANSTCSCQQSNEDKIVICEENDQPDTKLLYKPRAKYLEIECDRRCAKCFVENLHAFGFTHTTSVDVKNCPLPKIDFSSYVNGFNISSLWFKADRERPLQTIKAAVLHGMSSLTQLSLQACGLMYIPSDLFHFTPNLRSVSLRGNKLTSLPKNLLKAIPELEILDLGFNELCALTDPLGELQYLKRVYLFNNNLKTITRTVFETSNNITHLELQGNRLETLPEDCFDDLPLMENISLFSNLLQTLPPNLFSKNVNLKQVLLQDNKLFSNLPEQLLASHTFLEEINLSMSNFSSIPELALQGLTSLILLDLSYNKLTTLPEKLLQDCSSLQVLVLNHNSLTELPINIFRENKHLTKLSLEYNELVSLQHDIFLQTSSLIHIDLSHNHLVKLDDQFLALKQLNTINVAHNNLSHIGTYTFISCGNLQNLILNNNKLRNAYFDLPMNITNIDLSYNMIGEMPREWEQLLRIRALNLSHNIIKFVDVTNLQYQTEVFIDLQYNQLNSINMAGEDESVVKPVARLGFNPLNCDCGIESLLQHMVNQNQHRDIMVLLDIAHLRCQRPAYLFGKEVAELDKGDLVCNITTPKFCPKHCYCQFRTLHQITEVQCRNSALSKVPNLAPGNTSTLDLTGNQLTTLNGLDESRWNNLTALVLTKNNLSSLETELLPPNLQALYMEHNSLQSLSAETIAYLTRNSHLIIRLGHNPWICNCDDMSLQQWLDSSPNVVDKPNMTCTNFINTTVGRFQCREGGRDLSNLMISLVVVSVIVSIFVAFTGIAYYKYQQVIRIWLYSRGWCLYVVKEKDIDADKQFDAFVSFSQDDIEWVGHVLLPGLENEEPFYRLCIHHRNWPAGEWIPNQIERSVEASCRTIVVLSPNFLRSVWAKLEFQAAYYKALKDRMNRVIIVVLGDVPPKESMDPDMRRYVDLNTYVKYEDPWFWKKLRYAMPHNPVRSNGNSTIPNQWFINPGKSSCTSSSSPPSSQILEMSSLPS